jgi:hypothetical protein
MDDEWNDDELMQLFFEGKVKFEEKNMIIKFEKKDNNCIQTIHEDGNPCWLCFVCKESIDCNAEEWDQHIKDFIKSVKVSGISPDFMMDEFSKRFFDSICINMHDHIRKQ